MFNSNNQQKRESIFTQCVDTISKYSNIDIIKQYIDYRRNFEQTLYDIIYNYGTDISGKYIHEILTNNKISAIQKPDSNSVDYTETKKEVKLNNSKRKVIRINDLKINKTTFGDGGDMILVKNIFNEVDSIKSVAIFCNENINFGESSNKYVKYYLIINNTEYEVEPINSERNGIKIIKYADFHDNEDYVEYINNKIEKVSMRIEFSLTEGGFSPYLTDLKLLISED